MTDAEVEAVARAIMPEWFYMLDDGRCMLDNYPDQHKHYQERAREYARRAIAALDQARAKG
ncbi:MAG: hypothetical protein E6Q97_03530 [Desulfurellales bacterium]|nr:MAG: hypothetical protein E6Q97_03530 [Desulfurellales bacterium]